MEWKQRYDGQVRWILNLSLVLLLAGVVQAQINGPRPSVTSLGGQFTIFNPPGARASVTSLGPNGWGSGSCCGFGRRPVNPGFTFHPHHHRGDDSRGFYGGYPIIATPYYYPADVVDPVDDSMEQNYAPGPTIFDRHGDRSTATQQLDERLTRLEQAIDDAEEVKPSRSATQVEPAAPVREEPDTVLVFRDGHTVAVKNYAIVGDTLYEYTNDTRRKIALADLDVPATQKKNDDRGIDFRLPRGSGN
jgi:hypothetical protein